MANFCKLSVLFDTLCLAVMAGLLYGAVNFRRAPYFLSNATAILWGSKSPVAHHQHAITQRLATAHVADTQLTRSPSSSAIELPIFEAPSTTTAPGHDAFVMCPTSASQQPPDVQTKAIYGWFCSGLAPQPFSTDPELCKQPYDRKDPDSKRAPPKAVNKTLLKLEQLDPQVCEAIDRVVKGGLRWNEIGMDFTCVAQDVGVISKALGVYTNSGQNLVRDYRLQHGVRDFAALRHANREKAREFLENGFVQFDDWGVDMDQLQAEANQAWKGAATQTRAVKLQSIEALMKNSAVLELASFYLGSEATLKGYKLFRLDRKTTSGQYFSGLWHHDNCGMRLKLFIYLQDVDDGGAPTEIAPASQRTAFFNYKVAGTNRFDHAYVKSHYQPAVMKGPRGGGFIFDTNAVHRGNVDGVKRQAERDVVIVDFSSTGGGFGCSEAHTVTVNKKIPFPTLKK